jgi:predicted DCC family thiol-disulfide oxidoreductase YuxK
LKIALELNDPWPLVGLLGFIPIDWRDKAYDFIARHRKDWFKQTDACEVPDPKIRERFLA